MSEENISFEELLNSSMKNEKLGKTVKGTVIKITKNEEIIVDLNYKADGIIPKVEFSFDEGELPSKNIKVGDTLEADVLKMNDGQGNVLLSCKRRRRNDIKKEFEEKVENKEIFEEKIAEKNDKGVIVNYKGIRIFIPLSLAAGETENTIRFRVIEYLPKEHRIIGSAKILIDEEKAIKEEEFWANAKEENTYKGVVASVCSYGAFIDIGGVQGLLHISEMSWDRAAKAEEILKQGQEVNVTIKTLDKENKRMQLSYNEKGEDPWNNLEYNIGDVVRVKIKNMKPFGAFGELEKGVEGLIHISQICEDRIAKPEEKLELGEEVNAKIIDIDLDAKKIELSIKELEGTSEEYSSKE